MRIMKVRLSKDNKVFGIVELKPGVHEFVIDYDWDVAEQFTGMTDKTGNEIWEGDIVKHKKFGIGRIVYVAPNFYIKMEKTHLLKPLSSSNIERLSK